MAAVCNCFINTTVQWMNHSVISSSLQINWVVFFLMRAQTSYNCNNHFSLQDKLPRTHSWFINHFRKSRFLNKSKAKRRRDHRTNISTGRICQPIDREKWLFLILKCNKCKVQVSLKVELYWIQYGIEN